MNKVQTAFSLLCLLDYCEEHKIKTLEEYLKNRRERELTTDSYTLHLAISGDKD